MEPTTQEIFNKIKVIFDKYFVKHDMFLVKSIPLVSAEAVDCWFENDTLTMHRCLSIEDYNRLGELTWDI
jgi:hypothetical protein